MTELHGDFFVRLQEQSNWDRQQEVEERENEDQRPCVVETLVDWVVFACVTHTQSKSDDGEYGAHKWASLLHIGAGNEVENHNHDNNEGYKCHVECAYARDGAFEDAD